MTAAMQAETGFRTKYLRCLRGSLPAEKCTTSEDALLQLAVVDLTAGTAGAVVSVYAGQPMDTVKVKMQAFPSLHHSMLRCVASTYNTQGLRGLYAGTVPALAANIAENSVLFAAYGVCQTAVAYAAAAKDPSELSSLGNATAGFFAAFFSSLSLCPTELVKCRLQAMQELRHTQSIPQQLQQRIGPWSVTRHILQTEGVPGLFRGLSSTFAREMPGYFFFFGGYEYSRGMLAEEGQSKDDIGHWNTFLSGGVAGMCLWTAMFPTDVIKSRIQVMGSKISLTDMALNIYRNEGMRAFYNGLTPCMIRTFPATGLLLVTYELVKKTLRDVAM